MGGFVSGVDGVDRYLRNEAHKSQASGDARTWVLASDNEQVVGYYTVRTIVLDPDDAGPRFTSTSAPGYLIAKLGVTSALHGRKLGATLLVDAVSRIADASDLVGGRFVIVDASIGAFDFYKRWDFTPFTDNSRRLYMPMAGARAVRRASRGE